MFGNREVGTIFDSRGGGPGASWLPWSCGLSASSLALPRPKMLAKCTVITEYFFCVIASLFVAQCGDAGDSDILINSSVSMLQPEGELAPFGAPCLSDNDCGLGLGCFDQTCFCEPGKVICGTICVDPSTNHDHCGRCGFSCQPDASCEKGICVSASGVASDIGQVLGVGTPVQITGGTPESECYQWHNEAYPEDSVNGPSPPYANFIVSYNARYNNWADVWNDWNPTLQETPTAAPELTISADPWTTTSGSTGLEYVSYILRNTATFENCLGIAATTGVKIRSNQWDYLASCVGAAGGTDGPSIHYDLGASVLWAVDHVFPSYKLRLQIMKNCGVGQPGSTNCPVTSTITVTEGDLNGHPTVYVNPCTHNGIVAYRTLIPEKIILAFYTFNGTLVNKWVASSSAPLGSGATCPGCPDPNGGHIGLSKVHMSTKYYSGKCYAAITWDQKYTASDNKPYLKSRLMVVDITNELAPTIKSSYVSTNTSYPYHEFMSTASLNYYTTNAGWFFYTQESGPCNTKYIGWLHTNLFMSGGTWSKPTLAGPFPAVKFASRGLTDYLGIVQRGLPGGYLFPVWAQPVQTTATCVACQGSEWSNPSYGAIVIP